ncbi:MAG: hypothetical protein HY275_06835 [Gemmatimonadetes bacterium]|nr:hypothetical protein [Gemmatimonadota bacterium]
MQLTDFLLIGVVLVTAGATLTIGVRLARGHRAAARALAIRLGGTLALYFAVLIGTALVMPRRWVAIGEPQRFDDWTLTVTAARRTGDRLDVRARVANQGRGRAQAAPDAQLLLLTADGREIDFELPAGQRPLTDRVAAGSGYETSLVYHVPPGAQLLGLDVRHGIGPGRFVIGDHSSLFAERTLVRLP